MSGLSDGGFGVEWDAVTTTIRSEIKIKKKKKKLWLCAGSCHRQWTVLFLASTEGIWMRSSPNTIFHLSLSTAIAGVVKYRDEDNAPAQGLCRLQLQGIPSLCVQKQSSTQGRRQPLQPFKVF
jgi:hypothetical protein